MPSRPRALLRAAMLLCAYGGAACVLISVVPLIGLALPLRDVTGTVTREYTQRYGAKYSSNDRTLHYIVVNGTGFMTNNDGDSPSPAVGDAVRFAYHEGVNEIVRLEIVQRTARPAATTGSANPR